MATSKQPASPSRGANGGSAERALILVAFAVIGLFVYGPALEAPFVSDDLHYVQNNEILHAFDANTFVEILNPTGVLTLLVENYAPVHLFLHAVEWQAFGPQTFGYHVVNVLLHALASFLLFLLFERSGLPRLVALLGGAVFLVHSANVEAVAWISQLKSPAAMVLALGALLAHPRRPVLAAVLFTLGLFAKPSALFALPVLVIWTWVRASEPEEAEGGSWRWTWVGLWVLLFVAFAATEMLAFSQTAGTATPLYDGAADRIRSGFAIGLRYLAMFAVTYGLSTFHEPPPVQSWIDPWWLLSLPVFGLLGWRIFVVLRARRIEAIYWAWAAASFSAVSGLLQLPFPMADRYLYAILPGLLGAAFCMCVDVGDRLRARGLSGVRLETIARVALVAGVLLNVGFAVRSHARARVWTSPFLVLADSARNYPQGRAALNHRASRAAREGDAAAAVEALRAAYARGYNRLDQVLGDPEYAFMRDRSDFRALIDDMADDLLERVGNDPNPTQHELHAMAFAYNAKGDTSAAIRALERALETQGPITTRIEENLKGLQGQLRFEEIRDRAKQRRQPAG